MLGSPHDAEDALQDTLLRAWRALPKVHVRVSFHAWLYRIATNVCLDAIARRRKRIAPVDGAPGASPGDSAAAQPPALAPWIEPYRDGMLDVADAAAAPDARYERRETLELALIAALQRLPPRQRAVLILRDVLGFSAKETAESLDTTVPAVNGAVLRARRAIEKRRDEATARPAGDPGLRLTVQRFVDAFERGEVDAIRDLLTEEPTLAMRALP
jgi:RNA polymerase sigma-70 factor (ECF subfamily)